MLVRRLVLATMAAIVLLGFAPPARLHHPPSTARGAPNSAFPTELSGAAVFPPAPSPGPLLLSPSVLADPPQAVNSMAVRAENAERGTTSWRIGSPSAAGEIQAYANSASVNAGGSIQFYVSTKIQGTPYRIDLYRMGWYGGTGARLRNSVPGLTGIAQGYYTTASGLVGCRRCLKDPVTGLLDASWMPSYKLDVPAGWLSGVYLAQLTDRAGKQTYVPFVVRQDDRASALLLKASFNTYEAYNAWGGKSLYAYDSLGAPTVGGGTPAVKVSFNRPFDTDSGSGQFLRYEFNLVRWLERTGYDVSYMADKDLEENGDLLLRHRGFISAGHDEYWTAGQRQNVEQALSHGVDLAFLSGDAVYWQARYEPSSAGDALRTLVEYRGPSDPLFKSDPLHATVRWQDAPVSKSESSLTGTVYAGQTEPFTQDWVVKDTSSWLFAGTGLGPGDHVAGLVGKEFDRADPQGSGPAEIQVLSHSPISVVSPNPRSPAQSFAETTIYSAPSGSLVFSAGDVTWSWGLDDASYPLGPLHKTPVSPAIQRLTQNLLDAIAYGSPSPP